MPVVFFACVCVIFLRLSTLRNWETSSIRITRLAIHMDIASGRYVYRCVTVVYSV